MAFVKLKTMNSDMPQAHEIPGSSFPAEIPTILKDAGTAFAGMVIGSALRQKIRRKTALLHDDLETKLDQALDNVPK